MQHKPTEGSPRTSLVAETDTGAGGEADAAPHGRNVSGGVSYLRGLDERGEE